MNIIDILWSIGYDVLSFENSIYEVSMSHQKWLKENEISRKSDEINISKRSFIKVRDVGFNDLGNLYVVFINVDDNSFFDSYEYTVKENDKLF
ncbi:MAG: hypothetical protein E7D27_11265 [Clostridium celatum]|nr:hypothetical protein [Clostridium celatum]